MSLPYHIPVMLPETLEMLVTDRSGIYVDGTLGGGGHAGAILDLIRGSGKLYAFDADAGAIANARERFADELALGDAASIEVRQAYFSEACAMLEEEEVEITGVMLDLGISSRQIDSDQIGLSYRMEMPLDMRFDQASPRRNAREIINRESAEKLATLFRTFGEEPAAWKIARTIVDARMGRKIETTLDLREIVESVIPERFQLKTLSRIFQALRIVVNDELGELERALDCFVPLMKEGGRIAILTYHSLEDRIVKEKFREEEKSCVCPPALPVCRCDKEQRLKILTRKPIVPSDDEIAANPRARSAKLRVAERIFDTRPGRREAGGG